MQPRPLGALLIEQGLLSDEQLAAALSQQHITRDRLGDILLCGGMVSPLALYQVLAQQQSLPFADLLKYPPDAELLDLSQARTYLRLGMIPWRRVGDKIEVAACDLSEEAIAWIGAHYGDAAMIAMTSPLDIRRTIEAQFGEPLEKLSRFYLWKHFPHISAHMILASWQRLILYSFVLLFSLAFATVPAAVFLAFMLCCHGIYGTTLMFKYVIFKRGTSMPALGHGWPQRLATLDEGELPIYTVIVPMYREEQSVPAMLEAMQALDYPPAKLDIKLVLEDDDQQTLAAIQKLEPRYQFEIIRVPHGEPRTKPRACNYALHFARGEYVAIFDADDRPEPTQLKKAVYMFAQLPQDVACLQSRLIYYNTADNLLTRFFALEYHALFYVALRGLESFGIPIPLGGTSNHISLSHIRELGGWDPYNVTEDADLGVRLSTHGYRTAMLDSYTLEEAPNRVGAWLRQRSRWIKGYMQTWIVYMRHPLQLYRDLGRRGFLGFQCFIGLPGFSFLSAPLLWGITLVWVAHIAPFDGLVFPDWLKWITGFNLALSLFSHWYFAFYCERPYGNRIPGMTQAAVLYPFYLVLHSLASYKALWQLIFRPHFWEKTNHGGAKSCQNPLQQGEEGY